MLSSGMYYGISNQSRWRELSEVYFPSISLALPDDVRYSAFEHFSVVFYSLNISVSKRPL